MLTQETAAWILASFMESYLCTIPQNIFFSFFFQKFSNFVITFSFFPFSSTWDPMGAKISKHYFSHSFCPISTKFYVKYVSHWGNIGYYLFINLLVFFFFLGGGVIYPKLKLLWHFIESQANFLKTLATMVEYRHRLLLILTIGQVFKICGTLKF